ncbi:alkaline phosphatase family protein [Pseudenhygromyxa sp. WMMC2535]|uniref:alkaline phosphatase family protein n=1 Tax=Pseudenhygromyxa sp. WMMC2535 TaxID=2712867 RepID=UPI0015547F83|nr:alkaline phosphatase family protein [Pseudenhygromyxa sp. WMMC2535]NVB38078.1 alkaline phosphatase family protein [Pseudenhygromyxa sp. WMMC2535]
MSKKVLDSVRRLISRRRAMQGMGALFGAAAVGCSDEGASGTDDAGTGTEESDSSGGEDEVGTTESGSDGGESGSDDESGSTETETETDTSQDETDTDSETSAGGDACVDDTGLDAAAALAEVEHIIVLCMENRSFDHFFGARQLVEGQTDVDGLTGEESNPDGLGGEQQVFHLENFEPADPPHAWDPVHAQWNNGANDGFVTEQIAENGIDLAHEVMGYHVREDLPVLWALADEYTLCDRWFCSLLGPTWPNRYYLHCGTSNGRQGNTPAFPYPTTVQQACNDAGISNNNYYGDLAWRWGAFPLLGFGGTDSFDEFFTNIEDGKLEQVVILDPSFSSNDDHPSHSISLGQALIATVYEALAQSQYWEKCLLVITYDEHGGFYDHVPPPTTPDSEGSEWQQQGFRVPAVVIGPHVRKGCVNHTVFDHASFPATVTRRFGLPEMNERTAGVNDLASCIDPDTLGAPTPPSPLPKAVVNVEQVLARCGVHSSQEELMRATGNWPITPAFTARERARVMKLLETGQRLGAVELV